MDRMTRRTLLIAAPWTMLACERTFEAFCIDEHGVRSAVVVPEWLPLPDLRSTVRHLSGEHHRSFGIRELVRTTLGSWEVRNKTWKLLVWSDC
jgi:hypothetical protein